MPAGAARLLVRSWRDASRGCAAARSLLTRCQPGRRSWRRCCALAALATLASQYSGWNRSFRRRHRGVARLFLQRWRSSDSGAKLRSYDAVSHTLQGASNQCIRV